MAVDSTERAETFLTAVVDQLGQAVATGDAEVASHILDEVSDAGFPGAAAVLDAGLAQTSIAAQLAE
jgi:hypothetical protein